MLNSFTRLVLVVPSLPLPTDVDFTRLVLVVPSLPLPTDVEFTRLVLVVPSLPLHGNNNSNEMFAKREPLTQSRAFTGVVYRKQTEHPN